MTDQKKPQEDVPPGQAKTFVVTHPTDPSSPRTVTQEQWKEEKLGQAGWSKASDEEA